MNTGQQDKKAALWVYVRKNSKISLIEHNTKL